MKDEYQLRYLPLFEQELMDIVDYIKYNLQNPIAADNLVSEVEKAIIKRSHSPLSFEPCYSAYDREHDYYRIYVKNYVVYYVVIDDIMEIRRIVYNRRDRNKMV